MLQYKKELANSLNTDYITLGTYVIVSKKKKIGTLKIKDCFRSKEPYMCAKNVIMRMAVMCNKYEAGAPHLIICFADCPAPNTLPLTGNIEHTVIMPRMSGH